MHAAGGDRLHPLPAPRPQYVRHQQLIVVVGHGAGLGSSVGDGHACWQPPVPPPDAETSDVEEKTVLQVQEALRVGSHLPNIFFADTCLCACSLRLSGPCCTLKSPYCARQTGLPRSFGPDNLKSMLHVPNLAPPRG